MKEAMKPRERIEAVLSHKPTDRPAWSLWRHFYDRETTAPGLAEAMVWWAREFHFDFLKVNPRAQYHVEPWGCTFRYPGGPYDRPERLTYPIKTANDWARIEPVNPFEGALAEQLEALALIGARLAGEVPYVETIFTPLSVAGDMVGSQEDLLGHMVQAPGLLHQGLKAITVSFEAFARACIERGAAGIFLATTEWASSNLVSPIQYAEFGRPYDLRVLKAVEGAPFNVLHVCRENSLVAELADYPVQAINWAATSPSNPSIKDARAFTAKALIGGLSHASLSAPAPEAALAEMEAARDQAIGGPWVLGPDCSIPVNTPDGTLRELLGALAVSG